jgi:preprotein translocase subunit SecA
MDGIKEDSVGSLFNLQVQVQESPIMPEDGADGAVPPGPVISMAQAAAPPAVTPPAVAPPAGAPPAGSPRQAAQPAQPSRKARQQAGQAARTGPQSAATADEPSIPAGLARGLARPQRQGSLSYTAPSDDASGRAEHSTGSAGGANFANVGRNSPCPCGSGKKFKLCHGDPRNR